MTHFACATRFGFAIQMHKAIDLRQYARPVGIALRIIGIKPYVAQNIQHHRWAMLERCAQRQPRHSAYLLLKLAGQASILCVVPRIMRTRRHLISHQRAILQNKKLHAQYAHIPHRFCDFLRGLLCRRSQHIRRIRRGYGRCMQNPVTMHVLRQCVMRHLTIPTTSEQSRHFKSQW